METRAHFALVGAFVLVALVLIAGFSIWLGRSALEQQQDRYEIVFAGGVGGLQSGSAVRYRGIPVGRVTDLRIDPANVGQILVAIDLTAGTPVKTDTVATIEAQGITGLSLIQLEGGTQDAPLLTGKGGDLPRIPSAPGTLQRLAQSTPELLTGAVQLLDRARAVLSPETVSALNRTIQNLALLTDSVAEKRTDIARTLASLEQSSAQLQLLTEGLVTVAGDASGTLKKADTMLDTLNGSGKAAFDELAGASAEVRKLSGRLDKLTAQVSDPVADFSQTGLYEFTQLVTELRQLTTTLRRIATEFERDPASYVLGGSRRGVPAQ